MPHARYILLFNADCDEVLEEEKDYNLPLPVASGQETHSERTFLDSAENSCETFGSFRGLFNCEGNRTPKSLSAASEEFTPTPSLVSSPELPQSKFKDFIQSS